MSNESRLNNSVKNIIASLAGQIALVLAQYISRLILTRFLPIEYVGFSGLFTNILLVLSLAELGLGTAITYCLYKPLGEKNYPEVNAIIKKLRNIYRIIAIVVFSLGVCMTPTLKYLISDVDVDREVIIIYWLYLANTVASYCFAGKRSIFTADQKYRVVANVKYACMSATAFLQAVVIWLTKSYYFYMLIMIAGTLSQNIILTLLANKRYAHIFAEKAPCSVSSVTQKIYKNVFAMALHKVSSVAVQGTDNILISKLVGITTVGLYSNYIMIKQWVDALINTFFTGIIASVGNLYVTSSKEHLKKTFDFLFYICSWGTAFCSICLFELFNPFISVWLGEGFLLPDKVRLIIVINFYLSTMRQPIYTVKTATGSFWNDRYVSLAEAVINLTASIFLGKTFGIFGILLGTTISHLSTVFIAEPIIIYKNIFKENPVKYYLKFFEQTVYMLVATGVTHLCCLFVCGGWLGFIIKLLICVIVSNLVLFIFLFKKNQFQELISLVKKTIGMRKLSSFNRGE